MSYTPDPIISDAMQYRLIYAAMLPFFLVEAACRRLWLAGRNRPMDGPRSILVEAQAASANAMSLAFQG